jgi:vancomycin permeability regulator SanA
MAEVAARAPGGRVARFVRWFLGTVALGLAAIALGNGYLFYTTSGDIVRGVAEAPSRSVAIVLGNKVFADGSISRELAHRVRVALDLYRAGKVQRIFLSGAAVPELGYDEPAAMAGWLERRGVPRAAMILDGNGHRTAATMADAAAMGFHDALVCTQAYHLPRALYLARHAGLVATGVPAEPAGGSFSDEAHSFVREGLARAEILVEVALRGVRPGRL